MRAVRRSKSGILYKILSSLLYSFILASTAVAADLPFEGMMGFPSNKIKVDYSGFHEPNEPINQNRLGLRVPLLVGEKDNLSFSLRGSHLAVPRGVKIPGSDLIEVPESLSSLEAGLNYTRRLDDEKSIGGSFTYGSASDSLFATNDAIAVSANIFYSFPSEKNDRWIWALFYSNNSPNFRGLPIPAAAYFFKRSSVMGAVGVPFIFVRWTPVKEPWAFTLFDLLTIMKAEVSYGPPVAQVMMGFDWNQQTWHRHDVKDTDNKLYFDEKKVFLGARFLLARLALSEVQVGQSFDRSFYEGQGVGRKETGTAYLPSSWYASWSAKVEF